MTDGFDTTDPIECAGLVSDFRIAVSSGPGPAAEIVLSGAESGPTMVGSSEVSGLRIADPQVSRRHLSLAVTRDGLHLVDLGSRNGTFVNDVRVREAWLAGGERVRLGGSVLRIERLAQHPMAEPPARARFGKLIGASAAMRRIYPYCDRIAGSDVSVLIEGETGTGKEVLAESIHAASARSSDPFVVFDCTTVAPSLVESMLFGHEKGAFTGAVSAAPGVFEIADGGTLFIDEIGDLELGLQAKLLRAIQRGEVQRVGGRSWIKVDVRIISATRRDLEREIQEGRFRDDLYFRLVVARIQLPPLRARAEDVPILARVFWKQLGGEDDAFPENILPPLTDYAWPGNVRELYNRVAQRLALGDLAERPSAQFKAATLTSRDFIDDVIEQRQPLARARERIVIEFERRYLDVVLREHGGDTVKAAEVLGIGRRYLYRVKQRLG